MASQNHSRSLDDLRAEIRRAGLRATPARLAVLDFLRRSQRPVSHNDLVTTFAREPWNRTTLYRNLLDLEKGGLARRTELGDRVWRFVDVAAGHPAGDHPHFFCTRCGQVQCLPGLEVSPTAGDSAPRAVHNRQVEVQIHGFCDDCQ